LKTKSALIIVILSLSICISCNTIPGKKYFDSGYIKYKKGDYNSALLDLDSGLAINPNYIEAYFDKGRIYYYQNKIDSAYNTFKYAIEKHNKWHLLYFWSGICNSKLKKYMDAYNDYSKAIELNPKYSLAYFNRSLARKKYNESNINNYNFNNNYEFADIEMAIKLDSNISNYYAHRAILHKLAGKYYEALVDYNKAIKIDSLDDILFSSRALLKLDFLLDTTGAFEDVRKTLELNPKNVFGLNYTGYIYYIQKNFEEAEKYFKLALSKDTTWGFIYYNNGLVREHFKDYEKAIYYYDKAIKLDSNRQMYYRKRADSKCEFGKYNESIIDYNKALEINPFYGEAYFGRGKSNLKLKKLNEALDDLNKAIPLRDEQSEIGEVYFYCGLCKIELNDKEGACIDFNIAKDKGFEEVKAKIEQYCK
jgi:tetratricopeptide (TPR) repeat protein